MTGCNESGDVTNYSGTVNCKAVIVGTLTLFLRRGTGPGNFMGDIKFMMPNALGIYLHDTHDRSVFRREERARLARCDLLRFHSTTIPRFADVSFGSKADSKTNS